MILIDNSILIPSIVGIIALIIGLIFGIVIMHAKPSKKIKENREFAKAILDEANKKADQIVKDSKNEGKEFVRNLKDEADKEIRNRRKELNDIENRLSIRETNLDQKDILLQKKEDTYNTKLDQLQQRNANLDKREKDIEQKENNIDKEYERVANLSVSEAKEVVMELAKEKSALEVAKYLREQEEEAKSKANDTAKSILANSIQKYSQEVANERTVSVVALPSDDLKGRIIGREGRNIRAIEQLTGVDLIIDDTPEIITISCFDPIRREIAKLSLETLIKDGRIQPGRIEEIVEKSKEEVNESIRKAGEEALYELGISNMPVEMITTIGRLKYRTSYGQNGLQHSKEVAYMCGLMAVELGLNLSLARRCGLLHDLGKALDFEQEGSHVELGVRMAKKYGESDIVINAIEAHHGDVEPTSIYANLVIAADTLSAARPGARSETLENYIQRIEKLEQLSKSFEGVSQAFAIQAGREIRVMVAPEKMDDLRSYKLAKDIKDKIESDLTYPGQIKVTVIREVRANEIAK